MRRVKNRIWVLVGIFVCIFSILIYTAISDDVTSSQENIPEYINLFRKIDRVKLRILATAKSKNRLPVSTYIYDNKYNLCVLKMLLLRDLNLTKAVLFENKSSDITLNAVYGKAPGSDLKFYIKSGKSSVVSNINFKFDGDSIRNVVNSDSLYYSYFRFKNFSINYNNAPNDIIVIADNESLPGTLCFVKRGKSLFVLVMTVANGKKEMEPDLLLNMINRTN